MILKETAALKASELLKCESLSNYASLEQLSEIFWNDIKWDSNVISKWTSEMQALIKLCKFRAIIRNLLEWH